MLQLIPADIELFNTFIGKTDDLQLTVRDGYIYPLNAEGNRDYSQGKIEKKYVWETWDWTEEESRQWSLFRQRNDELYKAEEKNLPKGEFGNKELLKENISACSKYAIEHRFFERLLACGQTTGNDREALGIQQDILTYETPLRTITINYDKRMPLSDYEKKFIDKYIALHNELPKFGDKITGELKALHDMLPALWERIPLLKEKADKASGQIYIPPPEIKGDNISPMISFNIPTAEEQVTQVEDFNTQGQQMGNDVMELLSKSDAIYKQIYGEDEEGDESYVDDDEDEENSDPMFREVEKMFDEISDNWGKYSIDSCYLDDDWQEFLGLHDDENKRINAAWEEYVHESNVFTAVYFNYVDFLNTRFAERAEEADTDTGTPVWETDEFREETIHRYESGMSSPFFDVDDWHIIIDNFEHKHDEKNKAIALEKAFAQHPKNATLLLRKAQEEIGKHEYQKAMALVKEAEAQGPPHHPKLFFIKADLYEQMHAPEQAIPLYQKVLDAKGVELDTFKEDARNCLIDIYFKMEKYAECIPLQKELVEKHPDSDYIAANLSCYYRLNGMLKEARKTAEDFLKKFPDSSECIEQLGYVHVETKEYEKAIEFYERSYAIDKEENYGILYHKGKALMELKRFNEAVICFETSLLHFPIDSENHVEAAKCYMELKMPYATAYHYRKALEINPNCTEAMQQLQQTSLSN